MGGKTKIEWTDASWNPIRGCSRVSTGCINCYAESIAARFSEPGQPYNGLAHFVTYPGGEHEARWTGEVRFIEERLMDPLRWRKPRRIFVNSMSDLFHEKIPDKWIDRIFSVMALCPQHIFQVLTKRPERMRDYIRVWFERLAINDVFIDHPTGRTRFADLIDWSLLPSILPNVWLGTSCENQETTDERIPFLLQTPAAISFISAEPLLGPIDIQRFLEEPTRLSWVIIGGESGSGARPFHVSWANQIIEQCVTAGVACFVKQLGANVTGMHANGVNLTTLQLHDRKGGDPTEWPLSLQVRQWPK